MRFIAHLSDLHFGRVDPATLPALRNALMTAQPHVVVSGDLTQRARRHEFAAARRFLDSLPFLQLGVPGNHDIPLYNVCARAAVPFRAHRRAFREGLEPLILDLDVAVLGVNTARAVTSKNDRDNQRQIERGCARLEGCGPAITRVVVTHHPFDVSEACDARHLIGWAQTVMAAVPCPAPCAIVPPAGRRCWYGLVAPPAHAAASR